MRMLALLSVVGRILECRLVGAASPNGERQPAGIDVNRIAEQLAPLTVVARNHAGHRLLVGHRLAHTNLDLPGRPEPAAPRRVVDLNLDRLHALQVCGLEHPRELLVRGPAKATGEDVGDRFALALVAARVYEQNDRPRRAGLVVVVSAASTTLMSARSTSPARPSLTIHESAPRHSP